jgi:bifunctional non-homologous end joining protein LigD
VHEHSSPRIVMSQSIVGDGKAYYEQVKLMGLEGVVAKLRTGKYEPGKRSGSWLKFKGTQHLLCAIIGYEPSEERGLRSLIVAAPVDGELRWVGQVGSGITAETHEKLLALLNARLCRAPIVPCTIKGKWTVPDLFCRVSFLEWTTTGKLRGPVFESLHGVA